MRGLKLRYGGSAKEVRRSYSWSWLVQRALGYIRSTHAIDTEIFQLMSRSI